jgi:hypothetical protein
MSAPSGLLVIRRGQDPAHHRDAGAGPDRDRRRARPSARDGLRLAHSSAPRRAVHRHRAGARQRAGDQQRSPRADRGRATAALERMAERDDPAPRAMGRRHTRSRHSAATTARRGHRGLRTRPRRSAITRVGRGPRRKGHHGLAGTRHRDQQHRLTACTPWRSRFPCDSESAAQTYVAPRSTLFEISRRATRG